jgi:hypothetical protein
VSVAPDARYSMLPAAQRKAVAWMDLGRHVVCVGAETIARVGRVDRMTLDELSLCDLAELYDCDRSGDRYAIQSRSTGESWVVVGSSLALTPASQVTLHQLPPLVASHCLDMGIVGLAEHDGVVALVVDLRRLPYAGPVTERSGGARGAP